MPQEHSRVKILTCQIFQLVRHKGLKKVDGESISKISGFLMCLVLFIFSSLLAFRLLVHGLLYLKPLFRPSFNKQTNKQIVMHQGTTYIRANAHTNTKIDS